MEAHSSVYFVRNDRSIYLRRILILYVFRMSTFESLEVAIAMPCKQSSPAIRGI